MIKGALLLMDHEVKDAHPDCTVAVELKIYKNEGLNIVLPMNYSLQTLTRENSHFILTPIFI